MPRIKRPKYGSLMYWPRKRAESLLPDVNWDSIKTDEKGLKGFMGYKVGMVSVYVKDNTPDSMTKGKKIILPATIIECPDLKIFSVRFYKNNKVVGEVVVSNDKKLKKILKLPSKTKNIDDFKEDFDDLRIIVYSDLKKGFFKKTPDLVELALNGTKEEKLNFVKEKIGKPINVTEVFNGKLIDIRGVTKGKGLEGPVKRFGISLRQHKSEKGVRRPGSLGPWHPARVMFLTPIAGQTGFQTRICYNNIILKKSQTADLKKEFHKYGKVLGSYIVVTGSVPGPQKRVLLLTKSLRPTKDQLKKVYEFIEIA